MARIVFSAICLLAFVACSPDLKDSGSKDWGQGLGGVVTSADSGRPLADVMVYLGEHLVDHTDETGEYGIGGLGYFTGEVTFAKDEYETRKFTIPDDVPDYDGGRASLHLDVELLFAK